MSTTLLLEPPASPDPQPLAPVVAPAPAPRKTRRYESLDMWRGLCCLSLVVFHSTMQVTRHHFVDTEGTVTNFSTLLLWITARAWIGVPIFFVISGYCIMATLHARQKKGGVTEFAKRRFWRIYPPYWTAITLSAVAILVVDSIWPGLLYDGIFTVPNPYKMTGWEWLGNLTLTESWRHCVFGGDATHLLPNTWTLCYEEQFYVVATLILTLAPRRIFTAAVVITGLIFVGKSIAWTRGWDVTGSLIDGGWFQIAAGILLYFRINKATPRQVKWIYAALALGVLVSLRSPSKLLEFYPNGDTRRFIAFSFALLACFLYPYDQKMKQTWWLKPLWWVGGMSYSVYLIHPLIVKGISHGFFRSGVTDPTVTLALVVPLCLGAAVVAALVYYYLIERHFIPSKTKEERPTGGTGILPVQSTACLSG